MHPEDDAIGGEARFCGSWSVYPYFASGNILVNTLERGLFVVKYAPTGLRAHSACGFSPFYTLVTSNPIYVTLAGIWILLLAWLGRKVILTLRSRADSGYVAVAQTSKY